MISRSGSSTPGFASAISGSDQLVISPAKIFAIVSPSRLRCSVSRSRLYTTAMGEMYKGSSSASEPKQRSVRSEEHTSELQSRGHLVCCLLLEKKKFTA